MNKTFKNKSILVTGACGTVGSELVKQLLTSDNYSPKELIGLDNNESELFFLDQHYLDDSRASFYVTDIRDKDELINKMTGVDIIFHAAALKHVDRCELYPAEAFSVNVLGTQNIVKSAIEQNVKRVISISTDKAVNPIGVMGATKLLGEKALMSINPKNSIII